MTFRATMRALVCVALLSTAAPFSMLILKQSLPVYDITIIGVAVAGVLGALRFLRDQPLHRMSTLMPGAVALVVAVVVSGLAHRSPRLLASVLVIVGALMVGSVTSNAIRSSNTVGLLRVIAGFVFAQFVVSCLQIQRNGAVGGSWFGETESGFRRIGGVLSPSGTLVHANALGSVTAATTIALLLLLAQRPVRKLDRLLASVGAVMSASLTVLSLTRSAVVSLLVLVAVAAISTSRRALFPTLVAISLAGVGAGFVRSSAWVERSRVSTGGLEAAGSGRVALGRQAVALFRLDPVFGVGPNQYFSAIRQHPKIAQLSTETVAVHNVWLYVLATLGTIGVAALGWLTLDILKRLYRGGFWTIGLFAALIPPLMLDAAPFMGCGLIWTAATIGCMVGLSPMTRPRRWHTWQERLGAAAEHVEEPTLQRGIFADSSTGA